MFTQYRIFYCNHCGQVQFCFSKQKTQRCKRESCNKKINLKKVITISRTYDIKKAVKIVQAFKQEIGEYSENEKKQKN